MGFWDRLTGGSPKRTAPAPPTLLDQPLLLEQSGKISAHQALALLLPAVRALDSSALVTAIRSDSNIDHTGLARSWELDFDLPDRGTALLATVQPSGDDVDTTPLQLSASARPFTEPLPDPAFARSLAASLSMSVEQLEAARCREALARRPGPLPLEFHDSPAAVAELAAQGLDFIAGPSDLSLSSKRLGNGELVWCAADRQREYTTPFAG